VSGRQDYAVLLPGQSRYAFLDANRPSPGRDLVVDAVSGDFRIRRWQPPSEGVPKVVGMTPCSGKAQTVQVRFSDPTAVPWRNQVIGCLLLTLATPFTPI